MSRRSYALFQVILYVLALTWMISVSIMFIFIMSMAWGSPDHTLVLDVNSVGEMWLEVPLLFVLSVAFTVWGIQRVWLAWTGGEVVV